MLDVIGRNPGQFQVVALTAQNNVERLAAQCKQFDAQIAVIGNEDRLTELASALKNCAARAQPLAGTANGKGKGKGAKRRNQIIRSPPLMSSEAPVM